MPVAVEEMMGVPPSPWWSVARPLKWAREVARRRSVMDAYGARLCARSVPMLPPPSMWILGVASAVVEEEEVGEVEEDMARRRTKPKAGRG